MPRFRFPQLAFRCAWCHAPVGELCTNPARGRTRGDDTHDMRRTSWVIGTATCPFCEAAPGSPCMARPPALRTALPMPHPGRAEAAQAAYAAQHSTDQQLTITTVNVPGGPA